MNFDRINPLSHYFSNTTATAPTTASSANEMSDWGIEEPLFLPTRIRSSTTTGRSSTNSSVIGSSTRHHPHEEDEYGLHYAPPNPQFLMNLGGHLHKRLSLIARQLLEVQEEVDKGHMYEFKDFYEEYCGQDIIPNTANFSKFIKKYLSLEKRVGDFWEKFRYNLIVSNLLEDSMILSKQDQSLANLKQTLEQQKQIERRAGSSSFIQFLNFDGTELKITQKQYQLIYNLRYNNINLVVYVINLIIYLLKQLHHRRHSPPEVKQRQLKLFKVILIISMKLIKYRKFRIIIDTNKLLNSLNEFLMNNYVINKKLISNLINLKELEIYNFLPQNNHLGDANQSYKDKLNNHLLNSLSFLNLNIHTGIIKLLPYLNGGLLEQYCQLNNVNFESISQEYTGNDPIQRIVFHINKFNQSRKLFICQLLTLNETQIPTFFNYKLMQQFGVDILVHEEPYLPMTHKFALLKDILHDHNETVTNINRLFNKFDTTCNQQHHQQNRENEDILKQSQQPGSQDNDEMSLRNLDHLITKLSTLTTNLKYFKNYYHNESIDDESEKLTIYQNFNQDLSSINQIYQLVSHDISRQQQYHHHPPTSSHSSYTGSVGPASTSQHNGTSNGFNLKQFKSGRAGSITSRSDTPKTPTETYHNTFKSPTTTERPKRSSGGFQLVTVLEQPPIPELPRQPQSPEGVESMNQFTLDQLTARKRLLNVNRFSLNSMKSNISGLTELINSHTTLPTNEADGNDSDSEERVVLSKSQLRSRLEESFNRIYNLENENEVLKKSMSRSQEQSGFELQREEFGGGRRNNGQFLNELEGKLSHKLSNITERSIQG